MSLALYGLGGLRFWNEQEINLREQFISQCSAEVRKTLSHMNNAWRFARVEGPILTPRDYISASYTDDDIFVTNHEALGNQLCLRAETTHSSYMYARHLGGKMPLCVWQAGISSRREKTDGANAAKLRFNSFWQLEFQCIYSEGTKADYRQALIESVERLISCFTGEDTRIVPLDRLPSYSISTLDIEATYEGKWREMASCSIRNDYAEGFLVCEIAIGLDRLVTLAKDYWY